jgi:hypothetical protein
LRKPIESWLLHCAASEAQHDDCVRLVRSLLLLLLPPLLLLLLPLLLLLHPWLRPGGHLPE